MYYHLFIDRSSINLVKDVGEGTYINKNEEILTRLSQVSFEQDTKDLREIIHAFRQQNPDIRFAIIMLAGLFDEHIEYDRNSCDALTYPVSFTWNLHAWATLAAKYNEALRKYSTKENIPLIDFEAWARKEFIPRCDYFSDSVHPTPAGYEKMGLFIAEQLETNDLIAFSNNW